MSSSSFVLPPPAVVPPSSPDFVLSDFDALSSHMAQCSAAHGRWSAVKDGLRWAHSVAAGRIVTVACIAVVATATLASFA